jgi:hypothetical protein
LTNRRITIIGAGIFFLSAATALGQTARTKPQAQSSIGFIVPVYFNPQLNSGQDRSDSGRRTALGGWGELIAFASPLVAFHTGFEFPTATSTNVRHFGSAGFESAVSRRELVVYEVIGFHSQDASKARPTGLVGFGLAVSQIDDHRTEFRPIPPNLMTTIRKTLFVPSIMGGIEVPVNLGDKLALVAELRGRVALRKGLGFPFDEMFGRFSLTPGIGVRFHWRH